MIDLPCVVVLCTLSSCTLSSCIPYRVVLYTMHVTPLPCFLCVCVRVLYACITKHCMSQLLTSSATQITQQCCTAAMIQAAHLQRVDHALKAMRLRYTLHHKREMASVLAQQAAQLIVLHAALNARREVRLCVVVSCVLFIIHHPMYGYTP